MTRSKDRTRAAKFHFDRDGIPELTIEDNQPNIDIEWLNGALKAVESVSAFDLNFPKDVLKATHLDGALTLEFTLRGVDGQVITASSWPYVGVEGPRYLLGALTYPVPKANAETAITVASKNWV